MPDDKEEEVEKRGKMISERREKRKQHSFLITDCISFSLPVVFSCRRDFIQKVTAHSILTVA